MPNTLGGTTRTYISFYEEEKLAMEFLASDPVNKGMPVKLAADGTIEPWINSDGRQKCIGIAQKTITADMITFGGNGPQGPSVTVTMRGMAIIYGVTEPVGGFTALDAGPVTTTGASVTTGLTDYNVYVVAAGYSDQIGWSPDPVATGDTVSRFVIMD